jgi:hypothetical protein
LSFTNEEEPNQHTITMLPGGLNISNISFNEPSSPFNDKVNQQVSPPQQENIMAPPPQIIRSSTIRIASRQQLEECKQVNTSGGGGDYSGNSFES